MTSMNEMYQSVIIEHDRSPRNFRPIEGATSFVTGGDVSRFARRTLPVAKPVAMVAGPGGPSPRNFLEAPKGPVVRINRAGNVSEVPVKR